MRQIAVADFRANIKEHLPLAPFEVIDGRSKEILFTVHTKLSKPLENQSQIELWRKHSEELEVEVKKLVAEIERLKSQPIPGHNYSKEYIEKSSQGITTTTEEYKEVKYGKCEKCWKPDQLSLRKAPEWNGQLGQDVYRDMWLCKRCIKLIEKL